MKSKLLESIELIFKRRLSRKTGWGRNEVLIEYQASVNEALTKLIDLII
ncbi:hypothetical protein JW865_09355 [Candidatus Bathyarchaeota archaeon]|nr:hypothetical protein [Candidatus Bathyarchaeota archaeon]